jgi:lysozyme family protein
VITEERLIDDTFVREGDAYGDEHTVPPIDQPTGRGGIVLETLKAFIVATGSPLAPTLETLKALTHAQAREIVRWKLRQLARQHGIDQIPFEPLRLQVLDWAYNSGAPLAIRWLQRVLGVPRTGRMDPVTVAAVKFPDIARVPTWMSESLVAARLRMIDMATDPSGRVDHKFEEGLENRALSFSMLDVP